MARWTVTFLIFQVAGSNATEVNAAITAKIEEMSESLPEGLEFVQMMSSNDFLFASIHNVVETLVIAILLVILVVYNAGDCDSPRYPGGLFLPARL